MRVYRTRLVVQVMYMGGWKMRVGGDGRDKVIFERAGGVIEGVRLLLC